MKQTALIILALCLTACAPVIFTAIQTAGPTQPDRPSPTETSRASASQAATPAPLFCTVTTGAGNLGALNMRTCGAKNCAVIRILHEGERLQVIGRGAWLEVLTSENVRGFINSNYCKG